MLLWGRQRPITEKPHPALPEPHTSPSSQPIIWHCHSSYKFKPEFSGVNRLPHCQTKPFPAPGGLYHAAIKTNSQKANLLVNPTQLILVALGSQTKSPPCPLRLFQVNSWFPVSYHVHILAHTVLGTCLPIGYRFWFITLQCLKFFSTNDSSNNLDSPELWHVAN